MPGASEWLFVLVFGLAFLIFWIKAIIEIANSQFTDGTSKIVWLLIVIFLGVIGLLLYYLIGRKNRVIG